eukprot:9704989-Lingulodinium_polyedra.AAC.1
MDVGLRSSLRASKGPRRPGWRKRGPSAAAWIPPAAGRLHMGVAVARDHAPRAVGPSAGSP